MLRGKEEHSGKGGGGKKINIGNRKGKRAISTEKILM